MRLHACHTFLCAFAIGLLFAMPEKSYAGENDRITLNAENTTLQNIFTVIESQTPYRFVFTQDQLKNAKRVSVSVDKASLETVLALCFKDQPLTFTVEGRFVIVQTRSNYPSPPDNEIRGKITNEKGEGLQDVSLIIQQTNRGTKTDSAGEFVFHNILGTETMVISSVGYVGQTILLQGRKYIRITLHLSINALDEKVVKGYYNTTRRLNTGNVSTIKSSTIEQQPVSNPLAALQGQVAGLDITQATGSPGSSFKVMIRGQNSISNGNNPLYIVDGVPYAAESLSSSAISYSIIDQASPFNYLNPSDIDRVEILKDADATAIYGSRGANGVILITTKKGNQGGTRLDINFYGGAGRIARRMPVMNTQQYLSMRNEAFRNDNVVPDNFNARDLTIWDTTRYTDWEKMLIGNTSQIYNAQVNLSGGTQNTQFVVGMGYNSQSTVFPGDLGDHRTSAHFSLTHNSQDHKFKGFFSGNFMSDKNDLIQIDLTSLALKTPPDTPPLYDSIGQLNWGTASNRFSNPLAFLQRTFTSVATNLIGNAVLQYEMASGLILKANLGYTQTYLDENSVRPITAVSPYTNIKTGTSTFAGNHIKTWIIEPQMEYQKTLGKGRLSALLGATFQQSIQQGETTYGSGYTNDALLKNIAGASAVSIIESHYTQYRYEALFARINFDWQSKYLVNLTGRRDGSSRFGPGKQFANFGAFGLGWIFSKENLIRENLSWLSFGKLRGSYGITGNDQIGDYQYLSTFGPNLYPYQQIGGLSPLQLSNPEYSWETNRKSELAIELGFLNDRILFTLSAYRNISSNQLVGYSLPQITGFSSVLANLPATVLNNGTEWELRTVNLTSRDFIWTTAINLTIPHNELLSYPNIAGSPYANVYTVGKSLYTKKLYHSTGVDPQTGIYTFEDVNHDGQISYPNDLTSDKQVAKTFYGGIQNSFSYKGWQLDFLFQFVDQTGFNYQSSTDLAPGMMGNQPLLVQSRWQTKGEQAPVEKYTQDVNSDAYSQYLNESYLGDNTIVDASYVRLKNIALSWSFPQSWNQKLHLQKGRLYIQGQNLITITRYAGMDPENQSVIYLPPLKVLTAGIQITL